MRVKTVLKRISIFLLCFVLLSFSVFLSYSRTVKAAVPIVAVGISALASFLFASGVSLTTQNISNNATMTDTLNNLANQYSEENGAPTLEETIASQNALNYYYNNKAGEALVSMSDTVTNWFNGFKNWFVSNFALTDSGETIIFSEDKLTFLSGSYPYYPSSSIFVDGKVPISAVPIIPDSTQVITIDNRYSLNVLFGQPYDYYGHRMRVEIKLFDGASQVGSFVHVYASGADQSFDFIKIYFSQYNGNLAVRMAPDDWGGYTVENYGFTIPLTISSLDLDSIGLSGSLTDGYSDFEQALSDAKTEAGEKGQIAIGVGDVAVEKPVTDESLANAIIDKIISNTAEGTLVGGYVDEKEVEEENSAERVPTAAEIGEGIVLVDGLEDFFPFCIPFDLFEIINLLNVPAQAPKFDWKMSFAGRVDDYDISIDLTPYNSVAAVFRTMIIIVFLIFLTLKTRDLIRG